MYDIPKWARKHKNCYQLARKNAAYRASLWNTISDLFKEYLVTHADAIENPEDTEAAIRAQSLYDKLRLRDWENEQTPYWAIDSQRQRCDPPDWVEKYGYECYDPYLDSDLPHYYSVRKIT